MPYFPYYPSNLCCKRKTLCHFSLSLHNFQPQKKNKLNKMVLSLDFSIFFQNILLENIHSFCFSIKVIPFPFIYDRSKVVQNPNRSICQPHVIP